jgi:hypothetical protein
LFEGNRSFADGVDQACALLKATKPRPFPSDLINAKRFEWPSNLEEIVTDSIMCGERYDPTLELLPRRFDPILFWIVHPRMHGTPVEKRKYVI